MLYDFTLVTWSVDFGMIVFTIIFGTVFIGLYVFFLCSIFSTLFEKKKNLRVLDIMNVVPVLWCYFKLFMKLMSSIIWMSPMFSDITPSKLWSWCPRYYKCRPCPLMLFQVNYEVDVLVIMNVAYALWCSSISDSRRLFSRCLAVNWKIVSFEII